MMDAKNLNSTCRPTIDVTIQTLKNCRGTTELSGPCAIGAALEGAVGISPNNSPESDTMTHDMKASEGKCDVTLFSKSPERGDTYIIVSKYGYFDKKNRRAFMKDIKANTPDLFCRADATGITVYEDSGAEICYWSHDHCRAGYDKINNILKIKTKSKISTDGRQEFLVEKLTTFDNFSLDKFIELINSGAISIAPRRYFTSTTKNQLTGRFPSRDRGCAFRVSQRYLNQLYKNNTEH